MIPTIALANQQWMENGKAVVVAVTTNKNMQLLPVVLDFVLNHMAINQCTGRFAVEHLAEANTILSKHLFVSNKSKYTLNNGYLCQFTETQRP
jgi:hypothetical protein